MASSLLFFCLLHFSSNIGYTLDNYIIGGRPAKIEDFPYQVSLRFNSKEDGVLHLGGGAIITEKFVLTAAHCICFRKDHISVYHIKIFVGSTTLSGKGQTYNVEEAICHADYWKDIKFHDIAIIGVKTKIFFNTFVRPIKIARNKIRTGTILTVSGWGVINSIIEEEPDILQMLKVRKISLTECKIALESQNITLRNSQICTFAKINKSTSIGDSGGPVTLKGVLIGLVSWGVSKKLKHSHAKAQAIGKPDVQHSQRLVAVKQWLCAE